MKLEPLKKLGIWGAAEGAIELTAPLLAAGAAWVVAHTFLSAPSPGRTVTSLELAVLLGACAALTAWAASRQLFILRRRKPWTLVISAWIYLALFLFILTRMSPSGFTSTCVDVLGGEIIATQELVGRAFGEIRATGPEVCKVGGVPDNPYLPGTILRASWDGTLSPWMFLFLGLVTGVSALGLRETRLRPSKMAANLVDLLRYAPGGGSKTAMGKEKVKDGQIQACGNATLWGEMCGQIYSAEKKFEPGEWCLRCKQVYTRAKRELRFNVVSLYTDEVDVLNGLERVDTVGWSHGEPIPPDARISGEERWVQLGAITVPDVITVAQLLALVHEQLPKWAGTGNPRMQHAAKLAVRRASRVAAWVWFGSLVHRLTFARPSNHVLMALGSTRLKDLISESGEELWLQLDIGLLPLEVRTGFKKGGEDGRAPRLDNSKIDIWIPTSAPGVKDAQGVWVPRVEGNALRLWLSTDRLRGQNAGGLSEPVPYYRFEPENDQIQVPKVRPGSLDFVRVPLEGEGREPTMERTPGDSIADWDWLEAEQIQLMRQQCIVLMGR